MIQWKPWPHLSWRKILISLSKSVPQPPLNHKRKNIKSKSNYDFEAISCLVVTILIRLLLSIWDVANPNSISNKLFFRWWFFLVVLSQINFSDIDINFPRNQQEISGKSDIWLWCLIHVLWGWFVDFWVAKNNSLEISVQLLGTHKIDEKMKKIPNLPANHNHNIDTNNDLRNIICGPAN
jgi:hypothetical protein